MVGIGTAQASLGVFYSEVGRLRLSTDASGSNTGFGTLHVNKPIGATVKDAFLFAASTGFTSYTPPNGEVTLNGHSVSWDPSNTIVNGIESVNVAADVTSLVAPTIDAEPAGAVDLPITEANPYEMDGEILAVVFEDPAAPTNTVELMYGAQNTSGDHFAIGLSEATKPSTSLVMGLGVSYGYQPAGQYSTVDVNGTRLTSSAGGQDDCDEAESEGIPYEFCGNGTLITVGGVGDDTSNPSNPFAIDTECLGPASEPAPRCDDELYNLKPFVGTGVTSVGIDTLNPSADDNIMFASLILGAAAIVGEGVVLGPTGTRSQVETFHFMKALVQDEDGHPESGRLVHLKALSGPSAGMDLTAVTNSSGIANFNYLSTLTGTDTLVASYKDDSNVLHSSNEATQTWAKRVDGTFGGEWPYNGSELNLTYSYGGGHRYLGNVYQGVANWNGAGTHVHISPWPGGNTPDDIPVVDVNLPDTWWGMTVFNEECLTCGYTRNTVLLNQRTLDPESDSQRTKVATHEIGHALGLEHPYGHVSMSVPSVMWQGSLGGSIRQTPQEYDVLRVNGMYP
jgi:hypothetical protein